MASGCACKKENPDINTNEELLVSSIAQFSERTAVMLETIVCEKDNMWLTTCSPKKKKISTVKLCCVIKN